MINEERLKQNSCRKCLARYFSASKTSKWKALKVICMCAVVFMTVCMTAYYGKVTAFADETVEGSRLEIENIDLSEIYEIGGYEQPEQDDEESGMASLAAASSNAREDKIANAIKSFKTNINVRGMGITRSNVESVFANIMALHPEIVYVANASYSYNGSTGSVNALIIGYIPNAKSVKDSLTNAVKEVNRQVNIKNMKPAEIVLAYHEYLTSTVEYDASGIRGYNKVNGRDHKYDMYGTLVNKKAVCQGYAETMNYLLRKAGIPCALATSKYINHAWNVVRLNGRWYHVDATWDDPTDDLPGQSRHEYFLISTDTLNRRTKSVSSSYSLGRYDTKISGAWNGRYTGAVDKRYESGQMWSGVEKVMYYRNGYWYSIRQGNTPIEFEIVKHRFSTGGEKVILSGTSVWYKSDGSYYNGQFGSIFLAQESLYFNTARYIGRIDLDSPKNEYTLLYDIRGSYSDGINIYAMGWHNKQIVVWISDSPMCKARDAYLLNPCLKHSWNKGTVIKKATYASTGAKQYTCKKCSYKKTVSTPKLQLGKVSVKTAPNKKGIKLTWGKVSGATGYRVYRKTKNGSFQLLKSVNTSSLLDGRVSSGTTYTYKVAAYNKYTIGKATQVSRLFLGSANVKAGNKAGGVKIVWNRVKGADSYKIYRKTKTGSYRLMKTVNSGITSWIDNRVSECKEYTYAVMPYKKTTGGSYTPATIVYLKAPSVGLKKAKQGVTVSWTKSVGVDKYYVYRKISSGNWERMATLKKPKSLNWTDKSAAKGRRYQYTVIASRGTYTSAAASVKEIKR